jgi:hypothetical protein
LAVERVLAQPHVKRLLSTEHFSVDGTRIEALGVDEELQAWPGRTASRRGRNGQADFHGQSRLKETHASTTDPDARLYRKGPRINVGEPRATPTELEHKHYRDGRAVVISTQSLPFPVGHPRRRRRGALSAFAAKPIHHRARAARERRHVMG